MTSDLPPSSNDDLQFDRVEHASAEADAGATGVTCASCNTSISTAYYSVGDSPFCAQCKSALEAQLEPNTSLGALGRALLLGLGAAIAGAAVYYGVIAVTNLEIGIVAILIGYMVGWAVRKGASGRGARRLQVLAVCLTYFSVGLAYFPLALKSVAENKESAAVQADSTQENAAKASTPSGSTVATGDSTGKAAGVEVANTAKGEPGLLFALAAAAIAKALFASGYRSGARDHSLELSR